MTTAIVLRRAIPKDFHAGFCFHCGRPIFRLFNAAVSKAFDWLHTRDHVIPLKSIAASKRRNAPLLTVPSCLKCNQKKGSKQPSHAMVERAIRLNRNRKQRQRWYLGKFENNA